MRGISEILRRREACLHVTFMKSESIIYNCVSAPSWGQRDSVAVTYIIKLVFHKQIWNNSNHSLPLACLFTHFSAQSQKFILGMCKI